MVLLCVLPLWQENVEFLTDEFKNPKYSSYFVCKSTSVVCSLTPFFWNNGTAVPLKKEYNNLHIEEDQVCL